MSTPVKIIVETVTSERDRNGNCYHFAHFYIPSKSRERVLSMEVGGESNARSIARAAIGGDYEGVLDFVTTVTKRQFTVLSARAPYIPDDRAIETLRVALAEGGAL